jgi:DNA-binding NarL/FixJ family response regulator
MNRKEKSTILLVDDDKRVLRSLKLWFSNEGLTPLTASNGDEALKMITENQVDAALVDYRIDQENGIGIAQKLKEVDEELKIIILTGFPSYETAVQAMKIGAFDYLSKGAPNEKIISAVKKAISERERERAVKQQDTSGDKRIKMIMFCNHSLIKERVENFSRNSSDFRLVSSFPALNALRPLGLSQEIHIALICASCNLRTLSDAYAFFPQLYRTFPGLKTLIINESLTDREKVELLRLGVRGFCSRDAGCEVLEKAILHVSNGELWVSRRVTQMSLAAFTLNDSTPWLGPPQTSNSASPARSELEHPSAPLSPNKKSKGPFGLTTKETEILGKMSRGLKNKEIAAQLFISETTVKTHINRVLKKLGVDNRTKAILVAIERQIF